MGTKTNFQPGQVLTSGQLNTAFGQTASASDVAQIQNGTANDAGTLTGAETTPLSRGNGLLQTALSTIATFVLSIFTFIFAVGGTARSLINWIQDRSPSITDFGGIGDGVTNNTDAMRLAIKNSLSIKIPPQTFVFGPTETSGDVLLYMGTSNGSQTSRDGMTITGYGPKSVLKLADNVGPNTLLFGAGNGDSIRGFTLRNLTIDLNGLNNLQPSFTSPLRLNSAIYFFCYWEDVNLENVWFRDFSGSQMIRCGNDTAAGYGKRFRFTNCHTYNFGIAIPNNFTQDVSLAYVQGDDLRVSGGSTTCDEFTFDPSRGHTAFELHGDSSTEITGHEFTNVQLPWLMASSQKPTSGGNIHSNRYNECLYMGSLDPSALDQTDIDIGPANIFKSTKSTSTLLLIGIAGEVQKVRKNIRLFTNTFDLTGNANQDTHVLDLSNRWIQSLEAFDNNVIDANGSLLYLSGQVMADGICDISLRRNKLDSLGATGGTSYPNSPAFVHLETSSGTINSLNCSDNEFYNALGKVYTPFGLIKLSATFNSLYVDGNKNFVSSAYALTTGTPVVNQYKKIQLNYPARWQDSSYEADAFASITAGGTLNLFDFTGWSANDRAAFRISVFSTDGGATNNGITDYDVLVCGSAKVATHVASTGTYATDVTLQFTGNVLQISNANSSNLAVLPNYSGHASRAVSFLV